MQQSIIKRSKLSTKSYKPHHTNNNSNSSLYGINNNTYQKQSYVNNNNLSSKTIEQKLIDAKQLNQKLSKLFYHLKSNMHIKTLQYNNNKDSMIKNKQHLQIKKQLSTLQNQTQHLKNIQNVLLSENKKLKQDVNNKRKQRVIYSNIFKKYQKDIKLWEDQYKETLLNSLTAQDCQKKAREKLVKTKKKLEKEIKALQILKNQQEERKNKQNDFILNNLLTGGPDNQQISQDQRIQAYIRELEKSKKEEDQFITQSKLIILNSLAKQLLKIASTQNINEAIQMYQKIDEKTQNIYSQYQQQQEINKQLYKQIQLLQQEIKQKKVSNQNNNGKSDSMKNLEENQDLDQKIKEQKIRLKEMQDQLCKQLDINCRKLPTEQLKSFIQRSILSRIQSRRGTQKKLASNKTISNPPTETSRNGQHQISKIDKQKQNLPPISMLQKKPTTNNVHIHQQAPSNSSRKNELKKKNLLQKKLQQVQKQKSVDGYLLTYTQINQSMLKHYGGGLKEDMNGLKGKIISHDGHGKKAGKKLQ